MPTTARHRQGRVREHDRRRHRMLGFPHFWEQKRVPPCDGAVRESFVQHGALSVGIPRQEDRSFAALERGRISESLYRSSRDRSPLGSSHAMPASGDQNAIERSCARRSAGPRLPSSLGHHQPIAARFVPGEQPVSVETLTYAALGARLKISPVAARRLPSKLRLPRSLSEQSPGV